MCSYEVEESNRTDNLTLTSLIASLCFLLLKHHQELIREIKELHMVTKTSFQEADSNNHSSGPPCCEEKKEKDTWPLRLFSCEG